MCSSVKASGRTGPLRLHIDEGGLAGPAIDPAWDHGDVTSGYAGPVAPLGLSTQRPLPSVAVPPDPSMTVAETLRTALVARGIAVPAGADRLPAGTHASGERLGVVGSAPFGDQLALALSDSDNTLTAQLARVAAVQAGRPAAYADTAAWVTERLAAGGVPMAGVHIVDTSGLAPGTTATAAAVVAVLAAGTTGAAPDAGRVWAGLPVAALTGTLTERYIDGPQKAAAGLVRAKTGTLTSVSSLAGTVTDADGRALVFAVLADKVPPLGTLEARAALDRIGGALAGCGCR